MVADPFDRETMDPIGDPSAPPGSREAAPPGSPGPADPLGSLEGPGCTIGHYKLLSELGRGGFGVVFAAEQVEPVRRQVALKIIKPGMDSRDVVARFESEREALARMDHPHIARVIDAGVTDNGRPYFVMELVRGVPITDYCDTHRLSTPHRIELFLDVCSALQHAHQKGIVHRDLKPSNILVTLQDGNAVPKVIDFGIAKALHGRLGERTLHTELGRLIGTPEYMSPEQAEMSGLDVDTRADVYSLGAVLYELLTGTLPYDPASLRAKGYSEIHRIIREVDPVRPSTRLSNLGEMTDTVVRDHHAGIGVLRRQLRGDLDWIVLKAMEKDRSRRYESCAALADDLRRHLANEPVLARRPSSTYRLGKFVRRHRLMVGAALLVIVGLSVAAVIAALSLVEAHREADRAQAVSTFLQDVLAAPTPYGAGRDIRVEDLLRLASTSVTEALDGQAAEEAAIRQTLGRTYRNLGLLEEADIELERSADRFESAGDRFWRDRCRSMILRAEGLSEMGRFEALTELAQAVLAEVDRHGEDAPELREDAWIYWAESIRRSGTGDLDQAVKLYRDVYASRAERLGKSHASTLLAQAGLGLALVESGAADEGTALLQQRLAFDRQVLGVEHPDTLKSMDKVGWAYLMQSDYRAAESILGEGAALHRRVWGPEHPWTLQIEMNHVIALAGLERWDEVVQQARRVLEIQRAQFGDEHSRTRVLVQNLLDALRALGRDDEVAEACSTYQVSMTPPPPDRDATIDEINEYVTATVSNPCAEFDPASIRQAIAFAERAVGMAREREHGQIWVSLDNLAFAHHLLGQHERAATIQAEAMSHWPADDPQYRAALERLHGYEDEID